MSRLLPGRRAITVSATVGLMIGLAAVVPLTTLTATQGSAATSMDAVRRFAVPAGTTQVVLVRSSSWASTSATVEFFRRADAASPWVAALAAQAGRVGYNGMHDAATRLQNTGTTPAGIFGLPLAFGGAANPGTAMPYTRFDGNHWWPYDPIDPSTYNRYQTSRPSSARWRTAWAERLADYYTSTSRQYAYAAVIGFNLPASYAPARTGQGGGIFLHVNGRGATAGCVSLPEAAMVATLRWLNPAAHPVLISGPATWLDDAVSTGAGLSTILAPALSVPVGSTTGFTAVARPARMQWWRMSVTNACTGAAVTSGGGQGVAPVVARWDAKVSGRAAPPGLYRIRVDAGTATWTVQASLTWTVEVYAAGASTLADCPAVRLSGADRYATAVAVARSAAPAARTVVLAGGESAHLVDGLTAGPLAAHDGAALLLTATASLPAATAAEVRRRAATSVIVVGSTGAVSDGVVAAVRALGVASVRRISGVDRYATAAAVASEVGAGGGSAFVASGADANLVDGLSASGPAAHLGRPILLTAATQLPTSTATALTSLRVTHTDVVGSAAAVADTVLARLPDPRRLSGAGRFDTAAAVAGAFAAEVGGADVVLVTGTGSLVDALPGGALGRLVVLSGATLPTATSTFLRTGGATGLTVIGGPQATTPAAVDAAVQAIRAA